MCWYVEYVQYVLVIYAIIIFIDIDECGTGTDDCDVDATCTNIAGNFICTCNQGYGGDGVSCDGGLVSLLYIMHTDSYDHFRY